MSATAYCGLLTKTENNNQNPREASIRSRIFLMSLLYVGISLFVSRLLAKRKRYRPEIWYTYSHRPYLKTGFLFFRKNDPEGGEPRKIAVSPGFSAYLFDCLVYILVITMYYPIFLLCVFVVICSAQRGRNTLRRPVARECENSKLYS